MKFHLQTKGFAKLMGGFLKKRFYNEFRGFARDIQGSLKQFDKC